MKRYWKIIVLAFGAIAGISMFYINSALTVNSLPQFTFQKEAGATEAIKSVFVSGTFGEPNSNTTGEALTITSKGTEYEVQKSFLEQMDNSYSNGFKQLQDKYHGFMRGIPDAGSIYQDKDTLAYAVVKQNMKAERMESTFHVAVLDKKTDKETSFTMAMPERDSSSYLMIDKVQYTDGHLTAVTRNVINGGQEKQEIHVYTFDIKQKRLQSNELVAMDSPAKSNVSTNWEKLIEANNMALNEYIIYKKHNIVQSKTTPDSISTIGGLYIFHIKEKKLIEMKLPKAILDNLEAVSVYYDDSHMYIPHSDKGMLSVYRFDLDLNGKMSEVKIPGGKDLTYQQCVVKDGHIYILSTNEKSQQHLIVTDLKTGETVYRGVIAEKGGNRNSSGALHVDDLRID